MSKVSQILKFHDYVKQNWKTEIVKRDVLDDSSVMSCN